FSSRRRHTRFSRDWSSDVCSSDLQLGRQVLEVPCDSAGPDLDYLEQLLERRVFNCLIFSAIAVNPLGFSMSTEARIRLARLAARYQTHSIEDDTFGELAYGGLQKSRG